MEPVGDFTYKYSLLENNGHLYAAVGHSNASVYPGTIVNIDCPVTGFPLPDIIWSFNGRVLQPSKNAVEVKENGTLVLYYLSRDGQGYYECSAFNFAGGYTAKIFLKVTGMSEN